MNYKKLGNTDLDVSTICLGTMTWGEQNTQDEGFEQMDYALDQGVNFWDTAEIYSIPPKEETFGRTEEIMGNWFEKTKKRKKVILASKVCGPMDTFMEQEHPWLIKEKKAIKEFVVNLKKPYLGFCLGCQLLGEVVGGKVVKSSPAEIGIMDINFSKEKNEDKLFSGFPNKIKSLQWHSYEVQGIENNKDITLLASSPITKYQIFKYQNHAYAIQFHIEIKDTTVNEWGCVPEYKKALEDQLGDGALEKFDNSAKENMTDMNNYSEILYKNFKKIL
jgi:GMP synthase-like glutamine amidotransferase